MLTNDRIGNDPRRPAATSASNYRNYSRNRVSSSGRARFLPSRRKMQKRTPRQEPSPPDFRIERGDIRTHSCPTLLAARPSHHRLSQECPIESDEIPWRMRYTPTTSQQSDLNLPESPGQPCRILALTNSQMCSFTTVAA